MDTEEPMGTAPFLPISMMHPERFSNLFYPADQITLNKRSSLYLHILRIDAGEFALAPLMTALENCSMTYVYSRRHAEEAMNEPSRMMEFSRIVRGKFKSPNPEAGEGGEVILYALLESHLGAPKILSKMEIKTNNEDYVKGADGVHILRVADNSYEIIYGESKMYADSPNRPGSSVGNALTAAFASLRKSIDKGLDLETWLVESELLKETANDEVIAEIAKILLPDAPGDVIKNDAFGIMIGYEVDVSNIDFGNMSNEETVNALRNLAKNAVQNETTRIKSLMKKHDLERYSCHLYAIPFIRKAVGENTIGIEEVRIQIAERLTGRPMDPGKTTARQTRSAKRRSEGSRK